MFTTKSVDSLASHKSEEIKPDTLPSLPIEHILVEEFGKLKETLRYIDDEDNYRTISVKQYFDEDCFYRERDKREVAFDELYFDLIFVGK
jgi:hypothetical protein